MRTRHLTRLIALVLAGTAGCKSDYTIADPPEEPTLDTQVRQNIGGWGVVPILPVAQQNPALVELGRSLFFDKILSGNRDGALRGTNWRPAPSVRVVPSLTPPVPIGSERASVAWSAIV